LRRIVVTGLIAIATVLGGGATISSASAGTGGPASAGTSAPAAAPISAPFNTSSGPGVLPAAHHLAYPAGVTPAVTSPLDVLADVSCFHAGDCLAVGGNDTANGGFGSPIAYLWNGAWHATAVHLPSGATGGVLNSISCTKGLCLAVGTYWRGATSYLLAESWKGAGWSNSPQPPAISGAKYAALTVASCFSATFCVASGDYVPASNTRDAVAIAEVWNGGSWRLSKPTAPGPFHYAALYTVSCPTANFCLLGGVYASSVAAPDGGGYFDVLLERFDGAHWTQLSDASPTPVQGHASYLNSISCASTTTCAAVGEWTNITGTPVWHAFAETLTGTSWTLDSLPLPAGPASQLDEVSCPTTAYCVAVGGQGPYTHATYGKATYAVWNGSTWSVNYLVPPSGQGNILFGTHCLTSTNCIATGTEGTYNTNTGHGLTAFWNGVKWTTINTA
jgi:hypothetical protein